MSTDVEERREMGVGGSSGQRSKGTNIRRPLETTRTKKEGTVLSDIERHERPRTHIQLEGIQTDYQRRPTSNQVGNQ